jgi:hypothetical protein
MCFDTPPLSLPANAEMYLNKQWSPTEYHIQTVMININSLGRRMYLPMLQHFFYFALKFYLMSSTVRSFGRTMYIQRPSAC